MTAAAYAIGDTTTMRIAHVTGADDPTRAGHAGMLALLVAATIHIVVALLLVIFPDSVAWVFLGDRTPDNAEAYRWTEMLSWIGRPISSCRACRTSPNTHSAA